MKREINNYNINNPDGFNKQKFNDGKISFDNDNPSFIEENPCSSQGEFITVPETFDSKQTKKIEQSSTQNKAQQNTSAQNLSSSTHSMLSSMGSIGGLAGVVASVAVTAVIVAVAFVSTMTINVALLLSAPDKLVFEITIENVQEEDYLNPLYAILSGNNEIIEEKEITPDTLSLVFMGLEPGKSYKLVIKNEEKVYVSSSYVTPETWQETGHIETHIEGDMICAVVECPDLQEGQYYTLVAKDNEGNIVFAKDSNEPYYEYRFSITQTNNILFTLTVSGKVYSVSELNVASPVYAYDYTNGVWNWTEDYLSATVTFQEIYGNEPLVLSATISEETFEPTCENDGYSTYTATVIYEGTTYTDQRIYTDEGSALMHTYLVDSFVWYGYTAQAKCICSNDNTHIVYYDAAITNEITDVPTCEKTGIRTYTATYGNNTDTKEEVLAMLDHEYSELIAEVPATCDSDGLKAHYECSVCHKYFDEDKNETTLEALTIPAIGVLQPTMLTSDNISDDAIGKKVYLMTDDFGVGVALGQENNMSTDQSLFTEFTIIGISGSKWGDLKVTIVSPDGYYLTKAYSNISFNNTNAQEIILGLTGGLNAGNDLNPYMIIYEDGVIKLSNALSLEADYVYMYLLEPGHDYGELIAEVPATCDSDGLKAHYECSVCHKYFDEDKNETTLEALTIPATGVLQPETHIDLTEGRVLINPYGYTSSEDDLDNPTPFVSSADNPYIIQNQTITGCDNIITIYQTDTSIETTDFYIKLSNVSITAGNWCSLCRIVATQTVNIHLIIEGEVNLSVYGQAIFSSQEYGQATVNIIINQANGTFNPTYSNNGKLAEATSGTIKVVYESD